MHKARHHGAAHIYVHMCAQCAYTSRVCLKWVRIARDPSLFFCGSIFRVPHLPQYDTQSAKPQWTLACGLGFEAVLVLHWKTVCNSVILPLRIYASHLKASDLLFSLSSDFIQQYLHAIQRVFWIFAFSLFKCLSFTRWSFVILLDARTELYSSVFLLKSTF